MGKLPTGIPGATGTLCATSSGGHAAEQQAPTMGVPGGKTWGFSWDYSYYIYIYK